MKVSAETSGDAVELTFEGSSGPAETAAIWCDRYRLHGGGDLGFVAALAMAMHNHTPLTCTQPISPVLLSRHDDYQALLSRWYPQLRSIPVLAAPRSLEMPRSTRAFCFFTGGVDSYYTLLHNLPRLDAIVYVHGFDVPLTNQALRAVVTDSIRQTAADLSIELIEIESNLRDVSDPKVTWPTYVPSGLATIAHSLSDQFGRALIAGSFAYHELHPIASHPLADPLLSSELMTIEHDGCDATRLEKVAYIAKSDVARRHLRVCWENPGNSFNCGKCEKCIRTMVSLEAFGALSTFECFPSPIDLDAVRSVDLAGRAARRWATENLRALYRVGGHSELIRALAEQLVKSDTRRITRRLQRLVPAARPRPRN